MEFKQNKTQSKYPKHWNLKSFFPSFQGPEYLSFWEDLEKRKNELLNHFDPHPAIEEQNINEWVKFIAAYEEFETRAWHIGTFANTMYSVDTQNELLIKEIARITDWSSSLTKIGYALERSIGECEEAVFQKLIRHPQASELKFFLTEKRTQARDRMSAELEDLQVELGVNGELAWAQLYSQITGKLKFELLVPEKEKQMVSFSRKNSLLGSSDPAIRKAALVGSNEALKKHEDTLASALNALAGGRHTLWKRRGQSGFLSDPMRESRVQIATVESMFAAIKAQLPKLRKHLKNKARVLGKDKLGFQDLHAPVPSSGTNDSSVIDWDSGVELLLKTYKDYPRLQKFCEHAIVNEWIDSAPGDHRAPGGYCTGSHLIKEGRIFMTYDGTFGDVQTLAHELGHAFHSHVLREKRPLLGQYPMTLAETASTFAQTLFVKDVLAAKDTSEELKAQILSEMTNDVISFCMDIMMRFEFEKRFYTERLNGTLSAKDLCLLMTEVQKEVFDDALDENEFDPYFWASKMHFFFGGLSFYNFPYTFGYLLSRYLVSERKRVGSSFDATYENFLLASGSATCEDVCQTTLGVNITKEDFWAKALDGCLKDLEGYEAFFCAS
jgi:oligoendopeptidase F